MASLKEIEFLEFFKMGFKSLHAKLNNHYKSMELKEKEEENDEKHVKKLFRKNPKNKKVPFNSRPKAI